MCYKSWQLHKRYKYMLWFTNDACFHLSDVKRVWSLLFGARSICCHFKRREKLPQSWARQKRDSKLERVEWKVITAMINTWRKRLDGDVRPSTGTRASTGQIKNCSAAVMPLGRKSGNGGCLRDKMPKIQWAEKALLGDSVRERDRSVYLQAAAETTKSWKEYRCDCTTDHKHRRQALLLSCHCWGKLSPRKCLCVGKIKIKLSIGAIQSRTDDHTHH